MVMKQLMNDAASSVRIQFAILRLVCRLSGRESLQTTSKPSSTLPAKTLRDA